MIDEDGNDVEISDATIYVALFADEGGTQKISDIKSIKFTNTSEPQSVKFTDLKVDTTYYAFEVDENGNIINEINIEDKKFSVSINGIEIHLNKLGLTDGGYEPWEVFTNIYYSENE